VNKTMQGGLEKGHRCCEESKAEDEL